MINKFKCSLTLGIVMFSTGLSFNAQAGLPLCRDLSMQLKEPIFSDITRSRLHCGWDGKITKQLAPHVFAEGWGTKSSTSPWVYSSHYPESCASAVFVEVPGFYTLPGVSQIQVTPIGGYIPLIENNVETKTSQHVVGWNYLVPCEGEGYGPHD